MSFLPRLYAIADASFGDPVRLADALFDGGARLVQVRNKAAGARELLDQVERILRAAPPGATVIVNDRADVALIGRAGGVHLGQDDLPAAAARELLGRDSVIGLSTHNMEQALAGDKLPVDYLAVGPVFRTSTKSNPDPVIGVETLKQICRAVRKPVVAIGGVRLSDAKSVMDAGAHSIAVISDLLGVPDVPARVREWNRLL